MDIYKKYNFNLDDKNIKDDLLTDNIETKLNNYELLNLKYQIKPPKILVFGIGGGGCNAVNNMFIKGEIENVDFVIANTDLQSLNSSPLESKILLGRKVAGGMGAGCDPEVGKLAAEESIDEIIEVLQNVNMLFLTAGMGGGTGTGAVSIVAKKAKEMNILVAAIVTKPFLRDGLLTIKIANEGLEELRKYVDTLIVVPNQNLYKIANQDTTMKESLEKVDEVLSSGVKSITDLITKTGFVNLDFADIRTVMKKMGKSMMGTGEASGAERTIRAVEEAIYNPLLDNTSIKGAKGVIVNITSSPDITLFEYEEAQKRINEEIGDLTKAHIIFGNVFDPNMEDTVRVSIFATGIDSEEDENKRIEEENAIQNEEQYQNTTKQNNEKIYTINDIDLIESQNSLKRKILKNESDDDEDFFDIGEIKKYEEVPNRATQTQVQKSKFNFQYEEDKNLGYPEIQQNNKINNSKTEKPKEEKSGFLNFIFGNKKKNNNEKQNYKNNEEDDLLKISNFEDINIDLYNVPAYLRNNNNK